MLRRLIYWLYIKRGEWNMLSSPLYEQFKTPALPYLERERIKAKHYLKERGLA